MSDRSRDRGAPKASPTHARVISKRPAGPLATSPQLYRLHQLGMLKEALGEALYVTRERAWGLLAEAAEQGLWTAKTNRKKPAWKPNSRRRKR